MNRTRKFRAWDGQVMFTPDWADHTDFFVRCDGLIGYTHDSGVYEVYTHISTRSKEWILMDFTGAVIDGQECYEGDVIEFDRDEWGIGNNIFVVEWDEKNFGWSFGGGANGDMDWRKIIGNIYQNPELMPKKR